MKRGHHDLQGLVHREHPYTRMTDSALKDMSFVFEIFPRVWIQHVSVRAILYVLLSKKLAHATVFTDGQAMGLIHFMMLAVRDLDCPRTGPPTRCDRRQTNRCSSGGTNVGKCQPSRSCCEACLFSVKLGLRCRKHAIVNSSARLSLHAVWRVSKSWEMHLSVTKRLNRASNESSRTHHYLAHGKSELTFSIRFSSASASSFILSRPRLAKACCNKFLMAFSVTK